MANSNINDWFGNIVDLGPNANVDVPYDRTRAQQESNANEIANQRAQRESWGTNSNSGERVKTVGKKGAQGISEGGATTNKNTQTMTNYVPDPNDDASKKAADFYRTGRFTTVQKEVAGDLVDVQEWAPVPELMVSTSDRYEGVLASIKLLDPKKIKKNDNGDQGRAQLIPEYSKFFLESVQEAHQEKVQIVETFNDFYAFFYGERPPVYTFSGYLLNLQNYNWLNEFTYYYQNFWRGTKAVELGARVFLTYNYQQIQGYVLNINTNISAVTDKVAPFNIQVLVTNRLIFNGFDSEDLIRDNLLPRSDTGFINTTASSFSKALALEYLQGGIRPASGLDIASDKNNPRSTRIIKDNAASTKKEKFPGGNPKNNQFFKASDDMLKKFQIDTTSPSNGLKRAISLIA